MLRKFGILTPPSSLLRHIVFLLTKACLLFHRNDQNNDSISFTNFPGMISDSVKKPICDRSKVLITNTFPINVKSLLFHILMQFFILLIFSNHIAVSSMLYP